LPSNGGSIDKTYRSLSFELRASDIGDSIKDFLVANKDIAAKVQSGRSLSNEDKNRIRGFVVSKMTSGQLTYGLQFIQGKLYFVTVSAR
jgi:hypothetical protein